MIEWWHLKIEAVIHSVYNIELFRYVSAILNLHQQASG